MSVTDSRTSSATVLSTGRNSTKARVVAVEWQSTAAVEKDYTQRPLLVRRLLGPLMLNREEAWDYSTLTLNADGRFSIGGIPREPVKLILRIPGYRLASRRNRFQQTGTRSLALFVDRDRKDLEIYLEPIPK